MTAAVGVLGRLRRLIGGRPEMPPARARVPAGRLVYAIGDIHGRADLLEDMHRTIEADIRDRGADDAVVVYLGDYIDRGMQSREVVDLLLDRPVAGARPVHLLGNHEAMLLEFVDTGRNGVNWLYNGGNTTIYSYRVRLAAVPVEDADLAEFRPQLEAALQGRHLDFFRSLEIAHREGDYLFVHAGIRPGVPFDLQDPQDLIWIRDDFLGSRQDHGCIVVHGHTIAGEPEELANRIGIDTGAYMTGKLTCLALDGEARRFLAT